MSPFLVHNLGDMGYGIWSLVTSLSGYLLLMDLGIGSSLTRYVSKYYKIKDHTNLVSFVNSALLLYLIIGLLIVLISPVTAKVLLLIIKVDPEYKDPLYWLVIITSVDVAILLIRTSLRGVFQGLQRYEIINLVFILLHIVKAFSFYMLITFGLGLLSMASTGLILNLIAVFLFTMIIRYSYYFIHFNFKTVNKSSIKSIYNYSLFSFILMISNQVIYYSSSFVIGFFISASAITYYSIAWSLMEYSKRFCLAFSSVFVPVISEYEAVSNYDKIKDILNKGTKYTLILTMPLCVGVLMFGRPFIALWMGEDYADVCSSILIILIIGQFFELPQRICSSVLKGISMHKNFAIATAISGFFNLVLSIVLVQKYGLLGVALGTTIPQVFLFGIYVPLYTNSIIKQPIAVFFKKTYLKVLLPVLLLFGLLYYCNLYVTPDTYLMLLSEAITCVAIFLSVSLFLSFDTEEKQIIYSGLSKIRNKIFR